MSKTFQSMKLKEEIKQSKFRNEWLQGIVNIIYTYGWLKTRITDYLKPYDITMQQFNVLRILNGQKVPISTSEIRNRMLDKMSDASRIVDRLHKKGLVTRMTSSKDRRLVDVAITEDGRKIIQELDAKADTLDNILMSLTDEEAKVLNKLLDKIRD